MPTKVNITYFLGAGASSDRLPMVQNMPEKIMELSSMINSRRLSVRYPLPPNIGTNPQSIINELLQSLNWIAEEAKNYNTIDTYAKKLFLQNEKKKLNELKVTLAICFLYWQYYDGRSNNLKPAPNIDQRYISLLSSFLKKGDSQNDIILPSNLNFITWNYDSQIELGIQYFVDYIAYIEEVQNKYKSYPGCQLDKCTYTPQIIHLNGIAGLFSSGNHTGNRIDYIEREYKNWDKILTEFLSLYNSCVISGEQYNNHVFSFAWEENRVSQKGINSAIKILKESTHVVIIGYSFPVFNREVDRKLFSPEVTANWEKIYYQDPNPDKEAFVGTFSIPNPEIIKEITKTKQFFLPFEF